MVAGNMALPTEILLFWEENNSVYLPVMGSMQIEAFGIYYLPLVL